MAVATPKTVGIIGSAIAGPTLALQILSNSVLRSSFRPVLLDQAPAPGCVNHNERNRAGATVGLFANGLYPLRQLDLEDAVRKGGYECRELSTWSCGYEGGKEKLNTQQNAMWSHDLQAGVMYFERHGLQSLLVERVKRMGGELSWEKKAVGYEAVDEGRTRIIFADGADLVVDLLVGADGGYSEVRNFILNKRDETTAKERWLPDYMGLTGFYGVSRAKQASNATHGFGHSHLVWLDKGFLATGPCSDGKTRWDLIMPEENPPLATSPLTYPSRGELGNAESWESTIVPNQYPYSSTVETLRRHRNVFHPYSGSFEALLNSADRIIRTPLRQRVWKEDEIQWGNTVLIGDAGRLMLPTSGQGTGFAIEDGTVLASMLLKHACSANNNEGIRNALNEYARLRVPRSTKMANMASWVATLSSSQAWYYKLARYYGSKWTPSNDPRYVTEAVITCVYYAYHTRRKEQAKRPMAIQ